MTYKILFTLTSIALLCAPLYISTPGHTHPHKDTTQKSNLVTDIAQTPIEYLGDSDIPIAEGLSIDDEGDETDFDVPQGRIVEYKTFGRLDIKDAKAFYRGSLPALGWILEKENDTQIFFKRETENMEIIFQDSDDDLQVIFRITSSS